MTMTDPAIQTARADAFRGSLDLALVSGDPGGEQIWSGRTDPLWRNMIGPFGGWIAALLARAAERAAGQWIAGAGAGAGVVATNTSFMGPIAEGPLRIVTRPLRIGRSVGFWQVDLIQAGEGGEVLCCQATVTTGARRDTGDFTEPRSAMPAAPPAAEMPRFKPLPGMPGWFNAYDMRVVDGWPFSGAASSRGLTWLRHAPDVETVSDDAQARGDRGDWTPGREPAFDVAVIAGLADAVFPRVFLLDRRPRPVSTVMLSTYIHARPEVLATIGGAPVLAEAVARRAHDGFFDQQVTLWDAAGTVLATSEQLVWYK